MLVRDKGHVSAGKQSSPSTVPSGDFGVPYTLHFYHENLPTNNTQIHIHMSTCSCYLLILRSKPQKLKISWFSVEPVACSGLYSLKGLAAKVNDFLVFSRASSLQWTLQPQRSNRKS